MKKVLQISNYLYPHLGGIEQVARDFAGALSRREDVEQKIICFNEDAQGGMYTCHRGQTVTEVLDGIEIIRCGCFAKVASQSLSLAYPRQLAKVLKEFRPDLVVLHYPNPFVSSFLLTLLPKETKFVLYWHLDITKQKVLGKLFHGQTLALLRRADRVVATSPNYIEGSPYLSRFREKCTVIPNCVDVERFTVTESARQKAARIREENPGKTLCFAVGRHVPYKGMAYLVRAGKLLGENFRIFIGGKGPLTEELRLEAADDEKIVFLGRIGDEDLVAHYLACDIFCFPSITKNEAFGIALAEGMYFKKPAVTFTIPGSGVNYVSLNGITGIECPNCNSRAYAAALEQLAQDESLRIRYGENGYQRVVAHFTSGSYVENVLRLMESM